MRTSNLLLGFGFAALTMIIAGCSSAAEEEVGSSESGLTCGGSCSSGDLDGDPLLAPVTRTRGLRSDWAPNVQDLPANYYYGAMQRLRPDANAQFVAMVKDAFDNGHVDLYCGSGYRSFDTQCSLFNNYASSPGNGGCEGANTFSAHAGHSEHQLGTVCDIFVNGDFLGAGSDGDTWLKANAYRYGFANSYPHANASQNDGYIQEVWHYRYVGMAAAAAIQNRAPIAVPVFIASLSDAERTRLEGGTPIPPPDNNGGGGNNNNNNNNNGECGDVTADGRCDGTVLLWCKNGQKKRVDCATTQNGFTQCGKDPNAAGMNCVKPSDSPCRGFDENGTCTGSVLEWCKEGAYARVDCAAKTDGRTSCGVDPNPALGNNCITP